MDKPRPHRNVWIGMAVIAALLLIGLMIAYASGGSAAERAVAGMRSILATSGQANG